MKPHLVLACLVTGALFGKPEGKPNVLLLTIDDLNDWVGCLEGHLQASTPNLDRLAKRGILFTNTPLPSPHLQPL